MAKTKPQAHYDIQFGQRWIVVYTRAVPISKARWRSAQTFGTSGGVKLTERVLDRLAKQAEAGFDLAKLTPAKS